MGYSHSRVSKRDNPNHSTNKSNKTKLTKPAQGEGQEPMPTEAAGKGSQQGLTQTKTKAAITKEPIISSPNLVFLK